MQLFKTFAAASLALFALPAHADEEERQEIYSSLLTCAAFHTVESAKSQGDAAAAQQASAYDYAEAAALFAPDGKVATANTDLNALLERFKQKLDTGNPRDMAEQWTALESACQELHMAKDALVAKRRIEMGSGEEVR